MTGTPSEISSTDAAANALERSKMDVSKLIKFWHDEVLGRPMLTDAVAAGTNSKQEIVNYLDSTYRERIGELLKGLGIQVIEGDVSTLPMTVIRGHFQELFLDDNHVLSDEDRRQFLSDFAQNDQSEIEIGEMEENEEKTRAILELQSKKQREYLFLKGRQIQNLPSNITIFDFLPRIASDPQTRSANCSLATALGMEIAEKAGIEIDYADTPDHVIFVAHTKNGEYRGFDFHNPSPQWRLRLEERSYEGEDRFVLTDDPHNRYIDFRLIIRRPRNERVRSVLGNMNYFINMGTEELELFLQRSSNNPERDREMTRYFQVYGNDYFAETENELFGPTPAYVLSREWQEEVERLKAI